MKSAVICPIAHMETDFSEKFGIPRQSGLVAELKGRILFEEGYRRPEMLHGLENFSHIWVIWQFSEITEEGWRATVRPPRLGGNKRVGVIASRSPYRPNHLGLSCVKLERVLPNTPEGPVLEVSGVDLMNGTPIFDIKPYIPLTDMHPEATEGYTAETKEHHLPVEFPDSLLEVLPAEKREAIVAVLEGDPRPGYAKDPQKTYGVTFAGFDIGFTVTEGKVVVIRITCPDGRIVYARR